jgi:Na+/glutamate symporter
MARCEVCGNDYDKAFQVAAGATHTFGSFACAIHAMAPVCEHCGCKVVGHGVEARSPMFCCAHCARESAPEASAVADRA